MDIQIKRIYDPASPDDGARILVDRLWPRGVTKERAALTLWCKDIAPSTALRVQFGHMPEHMEAFAAQYRQELAMDAVHQAAVQQVLGMAKDGRVTLLYAAKDPRVNHAIVLKDYLIEAAKKLA